MHGAAEISDGITDSGITVKVKGFQAHSTALNTAVESWREHGKSQHSAHSAQTQSMQRIIADITAQCAMFWKGLAINCCYWPNPSGVYRATHYCGPHGFCLQGCGPGNTLSSTAPANEHSAAVVQKQPVCASRQTRSITASGIQHNVRCLALGSIHHNVGCIALGSLHHNIGRIACSTWHGITG